MNFFALHTRLNDCTTLKLRELVSNTSQLAPAPPRTRTQENMVAVLLKKSKMLDPIL